VPHILAGALQKACGIVQRRAMEEADIDVRLEGVDVSERRVLYACDGAAIVQQFANIGAAAAHLFKPSLCDPPQFIGRLTEPGVDRGVVADRTGEPKEPGQSRPSDLKLA